MSVQMELHQIVIREMQDSQIIVLKEVDGERNFPSSSEAMKPWPSTAASRAFPLCTP